MEEKIKVLQVLATLNVGGAEARSVDMLSVLDTRRFGMDFLAMSEDENQYFEADINALGGKIIKIPSPRETGAAENIRLMRRVMKSGGYSAVHANTSYHCGCVCLAAFLAGVPVRIAHARTSSSRHTSLSAKLSLFVGRILILLFATKRIAVSDIAGRFLFGRHPFDVIPDAVNLNSYSCVGKAEADALRRELSIPEDCFVVGQVGRFAPMKNHAFSVEVFSRLCEKEPGCRLVLVGDGELMNKTLAAVRQKGLENRVIFTGVRKEINVFMKMFDVLIFPSVFEGLPNVVLEAQAAGLPVVKSDNVTDEVKIVPGLVKSLSLDASKDEWAESLRSFKGAVRVHDGVIMSSFESRGLILKRVTGRFEKLYAEEDE